MNPHLEAALRIARSHLSADGAPPPPLLGRDQFAGGGVTAPPRTLPHALGHAMLLSTALNRSIPGAFRPRFADGGDAGDGGNDRGDGGENGDNGDGGYGGGYGGFGGFGGVGGVAGDDTGNSFSGAQSFDHSSAPVGSGMDDNTSTTMGAAMAGVRGLGPAGGASIGPSSIATADGNSFGSMNSNNVAGFSNMPAGSALGTTGTGSFNDGGLNNSMMNGYTTGPGGFVDRDTVGSIGTSAGGPFGAATGAGNPTGFGTFGAGAQSKDAGTTQDSSSPYGGLGGLTASGFGSFNGNTADSTSSDPATVDGAPSLTVHGLGTPAFASGDLTGDDAPSALSTPEAVRNFALADLAQNFGTDYGQKFGLPSTFSFNDPARVAAVVGAAQQQESSQNPSNINTSSLATGLNQMLGTGKWSNANPGPYSGSVADPAADRESTMLGFLGNQASVDPSSLDPRVVGIDAAQTALGTLPGTYTNQVAEGLAQLATNPMYRSTMQAIQNPNRSIVGTEGAYTSGFEAPGQDEANLTSREDTAAGLYNATRSQIAALGGLSSPTVTAGLSSPSYAAQATPAALPSAPSVDTSWAGGLSVPQSMYAPAPAYASDFDMSDDRLAPGRTGIHTLTAMRGLNQAMVDNPGEGTMTAAAMAANVRDNNTSYTDGGWSVAPSAPADPSTTTLDPNATPYAPNTSLPATSPTIQPGASTLPSAPTYTDPDTGVTAPIKNFNPAVSTGINAALGIANPILGGINALSGIFGGPSVGGLVTKYSSPGAPTSVTGTNVNSTVGSDQLVGGGYSSGSSGGTGYGSNSATSSAPATTSTASPISTAQAAYLNALKNLPGPSTGAWVSNPAGLVTPTAYGQPVYNPMTDPVVMRALAMANGRR